MRLPKAFLPRRRKGATLFEILLVLLAIAGLIAGATLLLSQTGSRDRLNQAQTQVSSLISGTRNYFTQYGTYAGLDNTMANNAGIFPKAMVTGTTADPIIRNPWSGPVTLAAGATDATNFTLAYSGLPNDICRNLLTMNASAQAGSIIQISAGTGATGGTVVYSTTLPMTAANVNTACSGGGTNNTIVWTIQ